MFDRKIAFLFVCFLGLVADSAIAQSEARIRVVIPSVAEVSDDLKWLFELSPDPNLRKQWKNFKEGLIDAFTQGVDEKLPFSVDLVFRKDDVGYEFRIPISDLTDKTKGFLPSMKGIGFNNKMVSPGYYELSEKNKKPFFLRYVEDKAANKINAKNYAWIYGVKDAVPANPPLATIDLQPLLNLQKDVVAEIKNDAAGLKVRRENFKEVRKQFEALIKIKRNEDPNEFELRKLAFTQQLDEAERFLVETDQLLITWKTDTAAKTARGEILVTALPGTELLKSIQEFAVKPSHFANVTLHENPLAVGKITFPLDASRIAHLKDFYKLVRPTLESKIKKGKDSDAQKTAIAKGMNTFIDMLEAGLATGVVDGFVDAHAVAPKTNVMVCGIASANGKMADVIIKLIPEMRDDWHLKPDAHDHGGVMIHELTIPKERLDAFQSVFAGQTIIYVGTSKDAVWGAAGADSLTHLKAAIDQVAKPAPEKVDPIVITYRIQASKMTSLAEVIEKEFPVPVDPANKEQLQRKKDLDRYRKLAEEAMSGCDSFLFGELKRTDDKIEGYLELTECVLKYVGSMIADAAKQLQ